MEPQGTVTRKAKTEKVVRGMPGTNYIEILSGARLLHLENEKTYFFLFLVTPFSLCYKISTWGFYTFRTVDFELLL